MIRTKRNPYKIIHIKCIVLDDIAFPSLLWHIRLGESLSAYQLVSEEVHIFLLEKLRIRNLRSQRICPSYHSTYRTRALDAHMLRASRNIYTWHTDKSWLKGVCIHDTRCGMQRGAHPFTLTSRVVLSQFFPRDLDLRHFYVTFFYHKLLNN